MTTYDLSTTDRPVRRAALAACLLLPFAGCEDRQEDAAPPEPPRVVVARPVARRVTHYLETSGSLAAVNAVDLVARVQGVLQDRSYVDGQVVSQGETLFTIEPAPYLAQLRQAQAQQKSAEAQLALSSAQYDRQVELNRSRTTTQAALDQAVAARDGDRAILEQRQAAVQAAAITYTYTRVTAPIAGIVTNHLVSVGNLVGGSSKLASVIQLDPIHVNFTIPEADVHRIRRRLSGSGLTIRDLGAIEVEVGLQGEVGHPHVGRLDYIQPGIDPSTGTIAARAVFDNKDTTLLPGAFVRVRVPQQREVEALLVPDEALGTDQGGDYLLVVDAANVVRQRRVVRGPLSGPLREIAGGLDATERVVVSGLARAAPGLTVRPVEAAEAAVGPGARP